VSELRTHRWRIAGVTATLVVVALGKQWYRDATPEDLRWILAPTARLVSWVSPGEYVYEAGAGWIDPEVMFVIAPSCAGVNFALAAFLALALGGLGGMTSARRVVHRLAAAAALAYAATLIVNTIRIAIGIALHQGRLSVGGLSRAELHRLEGIVVYLGGLVALYALARALDARRSHAHSP
jgi:exosortase K